MSGLRVEMKTKSYYTCTGIAYEYNNIIITTAKCQLSATINSHAVNLITTVITRQ